MAARHIRQQAHHRGAVACRCTTEISSMHRESLAAWLAEVEEQEMYQKEYEEEERVKARESREEEERKERKRQKRRAERRKAKAEAKAEL